MLPIPIQSSIFLKDAAEKWFLSVISHVKESTAMRYRFQMDHYIYPYLGEMPVDYMNYHVMENYVTTLLLHGGTNKKGLSEKTIQDTLVVLRSILRYAIRDGQVVSNDVFDYRLKKRIHPIRTFSRTEQDRLCHYLYDNLDDKNIGILLCLFTGLRVGELCALQWKDISFQEGTIMVYKTMQRIQNPDPQGPKTKIIITRPKTDNSIRIIPLVDKLADILSSYKEVSGKGGERIASSNEYFLTGQSDRFIEPRTMQYHFQKVMKECDIKRAKFHTLRHTFATRCVEMGFDVKTLSEILGHANVNITMNLYVHPTIEHKKENMQKLSALMNFPFE